MTKDEALKLALDALETSMYPQQKQLQAITAIKESLANEALEKMAENARELGLDYEPAQEPVAWKLVPRDATDEMLKAMDECSTEGYDERLYAGHAASVFMAAVDAAPAPPQRTWVGLTEDEILSISADCASSHQHTDIHFARAIEAKLRSKNESKN
jgi:hypothetical protein